jgi:hemerythrin
MEQLLIKRLQEIHRLLDKMVEYDHSAFSDSNQYLKSAGISFSEVIALRASTKYFLGEMK